MLNENNGITSLISCYEHYRYDLMSDSELAQLASPIQAGDVQKSQHLLVNTGKMNYKEELGICEKTKHMIYMIIEMENQQQE